MRWRNSGVQRGNQDGLFVATFCTSYYPQNKSTRSPSRTHTVYISIPTIICSLAHGHAGLMSRGSYNWILVKSEFFIACNCTYFIIFFFKRTRYLRIDSVHIKFVGHNLKDAHRRNICNFWLVTNISNIICRHVYDLSQCQISYIWLQWFIRYRHKPKIKYVFHALAIFFFTFYRK